MPGKRTRKGGDQLAGKSHVQCKLTRQADRGLETTYSWLPAKYAVVGKRVKLKDNGVWSEPWTVSETWSKRPSREVIAEAELWKKHREATDV